MKAMILCGGQGTRLREETEFKPKPLVEIGDVPILVHIMNTYAAYGVTDFILCLGYKGWMIKDYFLNYNLRTNDFTLCMDYDRTITMHADPMPMPWSITFADTGLTAMTGARIKRAAKYLGDDTQFMVTYGDGLCDVDLHALQAFHNAEESIGTVTGVRAPGRFGELNISENSVVSFTEKPKHTLGYINGGYFIFEREFLDRIDDDDQCILEQRPLESLAENGLLSVYRHDGFWMCMDTYREKVILEEMWLRGNAPWTQRACLAGATK
jgi:glucose-1-phosphate cytidylyltransferase